MQNGRNIMNLDNINKLNTREWAMFNGNSKSAQNRAKLLAKHGGRWEQRGRHWFWNSMVNINIQFFHRKETDRQKPRKIYVFTDKDGIKYITDNFERFCTEHNLNSSAMWEVSSGKRKQFKGFIVESLGFEEKPKKP